MRQFSYALNNIYYKCHIIVRHGRWQYFFIENIIERVCSIIPAIPFPPIKFKLNKKDTEFYGEEIITLKEWYGNISSWFCCEIHTPILNWCGKKINDSMFEVDYNKAKEVFEKYDPDFWKEPESDTEDE